MNKARGHLIVVMKYKGIPKKNNRTVDSRVGQTKENVECMKRIRYSPIIALYSKLVSLTRQR